MAKATELPEAIRDWLRARVGRDGMPTVGRELRMADATIARAIGGLPVQAGTIALLNAAYEADREAA